MAWPKAWGMDTRAAPTRINEPDTKPWVLLVEDEPTLSKLVGRLLDEAGYEHESIADHDGIAAAIARREPRCIILYSDPGSAGHERSWSDAATIRRLHPELPVLMFTSDPESMAEARAGTTARSRAAGYTAVIDKPFLIVEFLATLKQAVERPHTRFPNDGAGPATDEIAVFPELAGPASVGWQSADFFAMAVHELRSPLTAIDGHAQLAQRYLAKDFARASDALGRIREQAARLNRLINDLLEQTRASAGALSLSVVTFDLGVATAITIGLHEHDDPPRITFTTPAAVRVQGDPERIAQILANLLDNATKYSPPGSPIQVALTVVDTEAQIRVTDRGLGVPDDERDRIFGPFYRTSRTRAIPGTGLGLHLSRKLAEQHHGRLWLEATSDAGSVFALSLPLANGASH